LIHTEVNSTSYFLGPVGTSNPREFITAESKRIPFKAALSGLPCGKILSRTGLCSQLQAGEIGIKGYLQITVPKPEIGTASASPNVWRYLWLRLQRMKMF
jgi:hypothetical protein